MILWTCCSDASSGQFFHRPRRAANLGRDDVCLDLNICHGGKAGQRDARRSYRRTAGDYHLSGFLALQTAIVPCFYSAWHPWQYYVIGALFGIGMGGPMPMYALLFREFFGQKAIGSILGVFTAMYSTGMALGGYLGGLFHDRFDGYTEAFVLSLLAGTTATLLTFLLKPPEATRPPLHVPTISQLGTQRAS